jgi:hypothetical protein
LISVGFADFHRYSAQTAGLMMVDVAPRDVLRTAKGFKNDRETGLFERRHAGDGTGSKAIGSGQPGRRTGGEGRN